MNVRRTNLASFSGSPRFPAVAFKSQEEFQSYCREHQSQLEARDAYELTLATADTTVTRRGTCAPCLRPSQFVSVAQEADTFQSGPRVDWNRQMRCDCKDGLAGRQRALIHFLNATAIAPWTHLLLFGPSSDADARLAELVSATVHVPYLRPSLGAAGASAPALDAPSAHFHLVVSQDYLQFVPPLQAALAEIVRVLAPGGRFAFSIPFHFAAATSELIGGAALSFAPATPMEFRGSEHKLGWDVLSLLRLTGFREATAHLYWSEELGYLGKMNFLFNAVK